VDSIECVITYNDAEFGERTSIRDALFDWLASDHMRMSNLL